MDQATRDLVLAYVRAHSADVGECWEWQGGMTRGTTPAARFPGPVKLPNSVRKAVLLATLKISLGKRYARPKCGNFRCVNPEHVVAVPLHNIRREAASRTSYGKSIARRAAISRTKRSQSPLTNEMLQEIRASEESNKQLATRLGFSVRTIRIARKGYVHEKLTATPFTGLGARK
jgi:hypothetical protein